MAQPWNHRLNFKFKTPVLVALSLPMVILTPPVQAQSSPMPFNPSVERETLDTFSDPLETPLDSSSLDVITNTAQLRDVQPTDWAYQALDTLVQRYGCIAGYPDGTFRGNRALTRYEFAAALNACMQQIERVLRGAEETIAKADLGILQKLTIDFTTELAILRGRVDALEARTNELEATQFSTTTKLGVESLVYVGDAFGERASEVNNLSIGHRTRIDFNSSFSGQDRLRVRFQATNLRGLDTGATFGGVGFDGDVGQTGETRFTPSSLSQDNDIRLSQLEYRFPVNDRLKLYIEAGSVDPSYITDTITPFIDTATGGISNFGQVNPVFFPIGNRAGLGFNFAFSDRLSLDGAYFGEDSDNGPSNPGTDSGLFNGGYSAFAHLVYSGEKLKLGLLYINSFSQAFGVDTLAGSNAAKVIDYGDPDGNPVVGNGYGFQANYRFSPRFELGGWVGYTTARALGRVRGDANVWNYAVTLSFPDLFHKGNLGGLVLGMQPRLTGTSNGELAQAIGLPDGQRKDRDIGYHVEAFYRFQITENISITPGVFWLTAPNHDARNPDAIIGVIRTSFAF